jgi:hypothetical protein
VAHHNRSFELQNTIVANCCSRFAKH